MGKLVEDIQEGLTIAERLFLQKCQENNVNYDFQGRDISTERGYLIPSRHIDLFRELPHDKDFPNDIFMTFNGVDPNSEKIPCLYQNGSRTMVSFKVKPINDRTEEDLDSILDSKFEIPNNIYEDQYKFSSDKMCRKYSAFRSSFNITRSRGGISKDDYKPLREMVEFNPAISNPAFKHGEPNYNSLATQSANRTTDYTDEPRKKTQPKPNTRTASILKSKSKLKSTTQAINGTRLDATDIERIPNYTPVTNFIESISTVIERTIERRSLGNPDDPALQTGQKELKKIVPDASEDYKGLKASYGYDTKVVPDDVATREREGGGFNTLTKETIPNSTEIGGMGGSRNPNTNVPVANNTSNVTISGATSPMHPPQKITVLKSPRVKLRNR